MAYLGAGYNVVPLGTSALTTAIDANGNETAINLLNGDMFTFGSDTSLWRMGSYGAGTMSGMGDLVMWYQSHNCGFNAVTNTWNGRDDTGPCMVIAFTEGIGTNAPLIKTYMAASAAAGTTPTWVLVGTQDTTTGNITVAGAAAPVLGTITTVTSGAGSSTGTLTNAPAATNPTKWIPFNDAGVTRYIPAW